MAAIKQMDIHRLTYMGLDVLCSQWNNRETYYILFYLELLAFASKRQTEAHLDRITFFFNKQKLSAIYSIAGTQQGYRAQ